MLLPLPGLMGGFSWKALKFGAPDWTEDFVEGFLWIGQFDPTGITVGEPDWTEDYDQGVSWNV